MIDQEKIQRLTVALEKSIETFKDLHKAFVLLQRPKLAEACAFAANALEEDLKEIQA